ncbi:MAG: 2-succinyl-5-enolpyruvyl-6-hydroxy-3-cyclohexene-1-carboxylic-acid synthase [Actinobacteria bacterium]|nr:2-succinyl-5-enolpyruvyl-6-hydroxy-3-cyclohexene-1-carboxylic-acid synthase [Actinomycetota bacterium]
MASSQLFASQFIAQLRNLGVKSFYLAPGARSQALAIAANQLASAGQIDLTVRLDERSMGFMALGRALKQDYPVAVITTSGTAVANLHPAVLEAHHAGVPLILLTADRPAKLRGKGANQTTIQPGIFADAVRSCIDVDSDADPRLTAMRAVELAVGGELRPGPVQVNIQFAEPLADSAPSALEFLEEPGIVERRNQLTELDVLVSDHAVVVAGAGAGPAANEFATKAGLPLLAEPSSGARFGSALTNYIEDLKQLASEVDQVFVFGKPTLSRPVLNLLKTCDYWVQKPKNYEAFDVFSKALGFADQLNPIGTGSSQWLARWGSGPERNLRAELVTEVWNQTAQDEILLIGASELIRIAEKSVSPKDLSVFASRGLAGIDGSVSTALGLAQDGLRVRAVIGDLTLLHDASGLNRTGLGDLDLQLVVGNDNGGAIFSHLEMAQLIEKPDFETLFTTPQQVDLKALAQAYGWEYVKTTPSELLSHLGKRGFVLIDCQL